MYGKARSHRSIFGMNWSSAKAPLAVKLTLLFLIFLPWFINLTAQPVLGQTYRVIYDFTNGADGWFPATGLTIDAAGNLYGTTALGGLYGNGAVFKLTHFGSRWVFTLPYGFPDGYDGASPNGRVAIAQNGSLYGTAYLGGISGGTVFHLKPSPTAPRSVFAAWDENVLYRFNGYDGAGPQGDLAFDSLGNIYGTTLNGGDNGWGVIYKLTPSGGAWTETVLYSAPNCGYGCYPYGGVVLDTAGNLYGVFYIDRPDGYGAVYELSPSGSGWTEQTVYRFTGGSDGQWPRGGLILSPSGKLYGTTSTGGSNGGGTVFELTPASGGWTFNLVYAFSGDIGPQDKLLMDNAGNLYGTTSDGGGAYGLGSVFKLTPSDGGWTYTSLHDFAGGTDGADPFCSLVSDANGNLYGTTADGGLGSGQGYGIVFEITP